MMKNNISLYFCSDEILMANLDYAKTIETIIKNGIKIIQLRFKTTSKKEIIKKVKAVKVITDKYNAKLIINDYWEIAQKLNCSGVHIGQNDTPIKEIKRKMKGKIIGVSCTNLEEALEAEKNGATYLGVGSIFKTNTKKDAKIIGMEMLSLISKNIKIPIFAIGGINETNCKLFLNIKIDGIAMISSILKNNDIEKNITKIKNELLNSK